MKAETKSRIASDAVIIALCALMVGAAELLSEREIIFPEIAALTIGALAAPKRAWRTTRVRCVAFIAVCAVLGLCASVFLPLPLWAKITLVFAVCQALFLFSQTTFAPMISAAVLPVLLGTESVIYPISAIVMTTLVMLAELALTKAKLRGEEEFVPVPLPEKRDIADMLLRIGLAGIVAVAALFAGWRFCIAPPILVAFTEFSRRTCGARKKPVLAVSVIFACAAAGALCRGLFCVWLGLPLTIAAVAAMIAVLAVVRGTGLYLPPAGALAILPMIIPEDALLLYPVQVLVGTGAFMAAALFLFREQPQKA